MSIYLNNITKRYGQTTVVDNVTLEIESGEFFVLLGASGSGKSTLLRIIAGLTPLDGGSIRLNERDVTLLPPQKRDTGFVFQNYSLFQYMSVAENIAFALSIRRVPKRERDRRVEELLDLIGMREFGKRMPSQLSGGQQQRVALARALAHKPEVLLLDEPFSALDVKIRSQLRENLREIQRRLNVTAILVTHDQQEAFELADRIGIIDHGRLLEVGTPDELYRRPQQRFTATFLGNANLLKGHRNGSQIYLENAVLPAPPNTDHLSGKEVELLVRPEEIELALTEAELGGRVLGRGIVQEISFAGAQEKITVHLADNGQTLQVMFKPHEARRFDLTTGREVWIGVKEFHLLER